MSLERYTINDLLYLMARLRDPVDGCPWDIKQTLTSINHSTIEEAYELVDALQHAVGATGKADAHVKEELGDVLFQVIFYSQLAKEDGSFSFNDVVHELTTKLVRRHPHVFPERDLRARSDQQSKNESAIKQQWEDIKQEERSNKNQPALFADIPKALPALIRAQKIQKRASNTGFDWPDALSALNKVEEEAAELRYAIQSETPERAAEEMADLLFSCVNVSRLMQLDAESTLEKASKKFQQRFAHIEHQLSLKGEGLEEASLVDMNALWDEAKKLGL
ncbi:MAG: nucleoside triphosphate pyrophosphohydrolase [Sinobacterium sp.]|nr:nucleoside triphosphate pyrophosphohydrolase [Sinobacterium sp.]